MADETQPVDPAPPDADPLAAFRIKRCLKCDYDFTGLPLGNNCPECGEAYTRDMLLLVGWSHTGHVPGSGMWCLRFFLCTILLLLALLIFLPLVTSRSATVISWLWLVGLTLAALYVWRKVRQVRAGGNLRLLVTEDEVSRLSGRGHILLRVLDLQDLQKSPPQFGEALRRVRLKQHWDETCELLVDANFWKTFLMVDSVRIVLSCGEDEAQALAHDLRLRIARAIERQEHE